MPVLETLFHEFTSFWKEPMQATGIALVETHRETLLEGQVEFAMSAAFHSVRHAFMSGTHLGKLDNDCKSVTNEMVRTRTIHDMLRSREL
jgi:hypothetical protein